ncbi:MAG: nuclear transport factor 2 family protein [Acidimicrobiales bacterium]|jgi:hypothetical protein
MTTDERDADGRVPGPERLADQLAIQDLATSYAYAVDDRDWGRWEALFLPDALVDYTSASGIAGTPQEVAAWLPDAMSVFAFCLHTTSTHEIRFNGPDRAVGRVHAFNRNGVEWEGRNELFDVGVVYEDTYARVGPAWRFASRIEHTIYFGGGAFAEMILGVARSAATDRPPPFG